MQREEEDHSKVGHFAPGYEPVDPCEVDNSESDDEVLWLTSIAEEIIAKELIGTEKIVAEHLLAFGDAVNYDVLETLTGTDRNVLYATKSKVIKKLRERMKEIQQERNQPKGAS